MTKRAPTSYPKRTSQQWREIKAQACSRFARGESIDDIAAALHVSYEAVRVCRRKWEQGGVEAACAQAPLGAKSRLSQEQLAQLGDALLLGPAHWGYQTELWTLERMAALIKQLFGVAYHPSHVFKVLRGMGWSCQKPTRQAKERDEEAIARWLAEDWPRIKKGLNATAPR
jgi:transposase